MFKIFKNFKKKQVIMLGFAIALIFFQVQLELKLPDYMSQITTLVATPGSTMGQILKQGGMMLLCALCSLVLSILTGYLVSNVAGRLSMTVREKIYDKVQSFSMEEISRFSTASLITRSTNDITQIQMFVAMGVQIIVRAPLMAILAIGKIQNKGNFEWSLLTTICVSLVLVVIICVTRYATPRFKKIQELTDGLNRVTRENLTGLKVIRAFNAEAFQEAKFEKANNAVKKNNLQAHRAMQVLFPSLGIIMNGLSIGIYIIGAIVINKLSIMERLNTFSNMIVFTSYAMQVMMSFMMIVMIFMFLPRAQVSAKRINEVLSTNPTILDGDYDDTNSEGTVEFKNVSFKYPDAEGYVLSNLNFKVAKGEMVAIIGSTGSGKSTIIKLIERLFDATEGEVLVDGVNVKNYKQSVLHQKLGYVPQKSTIFSGTIESNVDYGENSEAKDVENSLKVAQAEDFASDIKHEISQGGTNLSGGQKQRVSIARAVNHKPRIYLFDDTFSALDYKTDKALRAALKKETEGATIIMVAQRIGTIKDANQILVIEDGKIVGLGKHQDLLKNCKVYQEIAYSQLSKEELEA